MKKYFLIILLLLLAAFAVLAAIRWDAWFHNPDEDAYTAPEKPANVLLTFGDQ